MSLPATLQTAIEAVLRDLAAVADPRLATDVLGDALRHYLALPEEGREAARYVETSGSADDRVRLARQMARAAALVAYDVAARQALECSAAADLAPEALGAQTPADHVAWSLRHTTAAPVRTDPDPTGPLP